MLPHRSFPNTLARLFSFGIVLTLFLSLLVSPQAGQAAGPQTLPAVGLVTDGGPIDDRSFNEMAYTGLHRAQVEGLVQEHVYIPSNSDYATGFAQCAADGNVLCISVGFLMTDATLTAANDYPSVNFAGVDASWQEQEYPANLRGMHFAVYEAAYLAGTLAGSMSTTHSIGVAGGMDIAPVNDFILPYRNGARWANPQTVVRVLYANNFDSEAAGASIADLLMGQGADVVYGVGGTMGNGAIKRAAEQGRWVVGVDVDTFFTAFNGGDGSVPGAELLLTSVQKKVDQAVYLTILDQVSNRFTSGTVEYNVANDGVGLSPFHLADGSIPADVRQTLDSVAQGIADGRIDVWASPRLVYLPVLVK